MILNNRIDPDHSSIECIRVYPYIKMFFRLTFPFTINNMKEINNNSIISK